MLGNINIMQSVIFKLNAGKGIRGKTDIICQLIVDVNGKEFYFSISSLAPQCATISYCQITMGLSVSCLAVSAKVM